MVNLVAIRLRVPSSGCMLRQRLRAACDPVHEELHRHPLLQGLADGPVDYGRYKAAIAGFHQAYLQLEAARAGALPEGIPDAPALNWLAQDLATHEIAAPALAMPDAAPSLTTPAHCLGYLYVKQGSTLGGQVISKRLQHDLGMQPGVSNRFFYGYGTQTGERWRVFQGYLEAYEAEATTIIEAAVASFAYIRRMLDMAHAHSQV